MSFGSVRQDLYFNSTPAFVPRINYTAVPSLSIKKATPRKQQLFSSPKLVTKFAKPHHRVNCHAPIYQCKQNLSPIILEQNKLEMSDRIYLTQVRRPVSSYQPGFYSGNIEDSPRFKTPLVQKISPFDISRSNMDAVCSKMTQSIILSTDTLDSLTDMSPPLSVDNFEKIKFLGQGKFGQVHLVKHKQTGFMCALKIIDKNVVREEKVQSQIAKELRIHSQLKSLNIISFYGFFDDQKFFYILLEYATQGSVFSKLKGKTRLQQPDIQPIAKGLCDGLRFMHRMGYIHRDIKPENIVLQFGVPKICDFGWATDCDDSHLCKSYCGTPLYISPEMIKKEFYGSSVDVWATGLVVYELLVGRGPFSIWSQNDMNQVITKRIEFPQYVDRSDKCEQFIRKCLEKHTFNRMQVSEALKHPFLNESPTVDLQYQFFELTNKILYANY